jgi:hypothetical protein
LHADLGSEEAQRFQASGFGADEETDGRSAVWSDGPRSKLWFRFDGQGADGCRLELVTAAFAPALPLQVEVGLNGRSLGSFAPEGDWRETRLAVPRDALANGTNALEFTYSNSVPVSGASDALLESRALALRFDTIDLDCQGSASTSGAKR